MAPSNTTVPSTSSPLRPPNSVALNLPKKTNNNNDSIKPVWSLDGGVTTPGGTDQVPLASKCDQHNRERTICCRDLKGDDERSLIDPDIVRDVIIGLADGLTVPFALTAGLSSLGSSRLVYVAGVAELVSGALSMGVGGFLSAQAERDHYRYLKRTTRERVERSCAGEMEREVAAILSPLGIDDSISRRVAGSLLQTEANLPLPAAEGPSAFGLFLRKFARGPKFSNVGTESERLIPNRAMAEGGEELDDDKGLTAFLLKFGEGREEISDSRLFISAFTIGGSYALGGLVPLLPYFLVETALEGLYISILITTIVLLAFGGFKTYYTGAEVGVKGYLYGCISTLAVGGSAAAASFAIVKALEGTGL